MCYPAFYRETIHTSRRNRRCSGCGKVITAGEQYLKIIGKWDGDFSQHSYHPSCREWENELNDHGYPDEWMPLWQHVCDGEGSLEDAPFDVIARFKGDDKK